MQNSQILTAVRTQRHLGIEAVAESASISPKRLADFEAGERQPSRKQLERLAEIYGISLFSLYGKDIPNLPPLPKDFRKAKPETATLSPRGMKVFWNSEQISYFAKQLSIELGYERPNLWTRFRDTPEARLQASSYRDLFDKWLEPRSEKLNFVGSPEQKFLAALRLFFEVQGSVVNNNDAPSSDYLGFFVEPDAGVPTIFVNRSIQSKKAQLFTFVHEWAHALVGADGISNPFLLQNDIERSCNVFAAEFLAPISSFKVPAEEASASVRQDTAKYISYVSARSLLSKHAAAIRLVETGYLNQRQLSTWETWWRKFVRAEKDEEKEASDLVHGHAHAKRISELGVFPVFLAAKAVQEKSIDQYDVEKGIGLAISLQEKAFSLAQRRFAVALG